jgi:fido (protein-threonine AMPylation protein)
VNPPPGPPEETDPCLDPNSGVLRNLLGIADPAVLEQADVDFSAVRLAQLQPACETTGRVSDDHQVPVRLTR